MIRRPHLSPGTAPGAPSDEATATERRGGAEGCNGPVQRPMRMEAYYYSFEPTGVEAIDRILSAVACAGKAFHNTSEWSDSECEPYEPFLRGRTVIDHIQNAANDAADVFRAAPR